MRVPWTPEQQRAEWEYRAQTRQNDGTCYPKPAANKMLTGEILKTGSKRWTLIVPGRDQEYYTTKSQAQARLRWLVRWKANQAENEREPK